MVVAPIADRARSTTTTVNSGERRIERHPCRKSWPASISQGVTCSVGRLAMTGGQHTSDGYKSMTVPAARARRAYPDELDMRQLSRLRCDKCRMTRRGAAACGRPRGTTDTPRARNPERALRARQPGIGRRDPVAADRPAGRLLGARDARAPREEGRPQAPGRRPEVRLLGDDLAGHRQAQRPATVRADVLWRLGDAA